MLEQEAKLAAATAEFPPFKLTPIRHDDGVWGVRATDPSGDYRDFDKAQDFTDRYEGMKRRGTI